MKERRAATLILYTKEKKVLLQHRAEDAERLPGYWAVFGGGIEEGETPEEAVKREIFEEIEYKVKNPVLFSQEESIQGDLRVIGHTFLEEYDESQPIRQHEGQGYGWFTIPEALELKITEARKQNLLKVKEYLDNL
jgi:8-oxo-dGTP diphosphatase